MLFVPSWGAFDDENVYLCFLCSERFAGSFSLFIKLLLCKYYLHCNSHANTAVRCGDNSVFASLDDL